MKTAWTNVTPQDRRSPWTLVALLALLGLGLARPVASGAAPGVLNLVTSHPDWTYGNTYSADPYHDPVPINWDNTPNTLFALNNVLLFWGYDRDHGFELWRCSGTASGTALVKDLEPGTSSSWLDHKILYNGAYLFMVYHGRYLWRSDGTTAGTVRLKEFSPYTSVDVQFSPLVEYKGKVYFCHRVLGRCDLWRTDGTAAGTATVASFDSTAWINFFEYDGLLYMYDGTTLSCTDGTAAGTRVLGVHLGSRIFNVNGVLYYFRRDLVRPGQFLCRSNGPTAPETILKESFSSVDSDLYRLSPTDGTVYFAADDGVHGRELWKCDGTTAGTTMVLDLQPGAAASNAGNLVVMNGELFFSTSAGGGYGAALWKSDGSAGGTKLVREFHPKTSVTSLGQPTDLMNVNGVLYFNADDGEGYNHLWRSDGSTSGTKPVPCASNLGYYSPRGMAAVGDRLFLSAPNIPAVGYNAGSGAIWVMDLKANAVGGWAAYE